MGQTENWPKKGGVIFCLSTPSYQKVNMMFLSYQSYFLVGQGPYRNPNPSTLKIVISLEFGLAARPCKTSTWLFLQDLGLVLQPCSHKKCETLYVHKYVLSEHSRKVVLVLYKVAGTQKAGSIPLFEGCSPSHWSCYIWREQGLAWSCSDIS